MSAFLSSTNVPALAPAARRVPGRRYAYGPTWQSSPISTPRATVLATFVRSPTIVSTRCESGPTTVAAAVVGSGAGVTDVAGDPVVLVAYHAAVAGRVGGGHREDRRRRVLHAVLSREHRDRLGAQQRVVARQHEDVVFRVEVVEGAR